MQKIIVSLMALCLVLGTNAQNKKMIIGEWLAEEMYLNGELLFSRSNPAGVFAAFKKIAFGDAKVLSETDSLAVLETIEEAKKNIGSITVGFDAKGNHTTGSYDTKTKKQSYAKGTYKFVPGDDNTLLIKMAKSKTADRSSIVELTATTLIIKEETGEAKDEAVVMAFTRKPAKQQKPKK
jgi:Lipocalin-like domain